MDCAFSNLQGMPTAYTPLSGADCTGSQRDAQARLAKTLTIRAFSSTFTEERKEVPLGGSYSNDSLHGMLFELTVH